MTRFVEVMPQLSITPAERARKAFSRVLQRMQEPGMGVALSASMGVSESTVSRLKTEQLENVLTMIHTLGFKVVTEGKVCVDALELQMLRQTYARAVQNEQVSAQLFGDDE